MLGPESYGELAAILGLIAIVLLPSTALQMAVSREVSRITVTDSSTAAQAFSRGMLSAALRATLPLVLVAAVLSAALSSTLDIRAWALVVASLTLINALIGPVALGIIQGEQRFAALAAIKEITFPIRLALLGIALMIGAKLLGIVIVMAIAAMLATACTLLPIRHIRRVPKAPVAGALRSFSSYLGPVVVGLFGMALLVNIDVVVVNATFPDDDAGAYGAAAAFGRVGYFMPATLLAVLFPRTAERQARGERTDDILGRSLILTAAFCTALALGYLAVGAPLIRLSFGTEYDAAAGLLPLFALEMMFISLANVLVGFGLSRGETRYAWIVAASVPIQVVALATIPDTLREVVLVNIAVGMLLIVAHELGVGSSIGALKAGMSHFRAAYRTRAS